MRATEFTYKHKRLDHDEWLRLAKLLEIMVNRGVAGPGALVTASAFHDGNSMKWSHAQPIKGEALDCVRDVLDQAAIVFNGPKDQSGDWFCITCEGTNEFRTCRTHEHEYGVYVAAMLLLGMHISPDKWEVPNGVFGGLWLSAQALISNTIGIDAKIPAHLCRPVKAKRPRKADLLAEIARPDRLDFRV